MQDIFISCIFHTSYSAYVSIYIKKFVIVYKSNITKENILYILFDQDSLLIVFHFTVHAVYMWQLYFFNLF